MKPRLLLTQIDIHDVGTLNTTKRAGPAAIIFLGPPGAGKGTQARHVATEYRLPYISTGDVFRAHVAQKTGFGLQAAEIMSRGMLVPDEVVCGMLEDHIRGLVSARCLVLDGFPRSVGQAKWLDRFLHAQSGECHDFSRNVPVAISINVDRDLLLRRLVGRRSCPSCGRTYNLHFQPPKNPGTCDYDDGMLLTRPDDSESVVCERLIVYDQNALPVIEYYRHKGQLLEIDGSDTVDGVKAAIAIEVESAFAFATK